MADDRDNVVDMAGTRVDDDHLLSMYIDNELDAERTIALITRLRNGASAPGASRDHGSQR